MSRRAKAAPMANQEVSVAITITDDEAKALAGLFGIELEHGASAADTLAPVVRGLTNAAFREYLAAIAGDRPATGIRDLRELRLVLMAEHLPGGLPSDIQVAQLFHLTSSQARTLIAGTRARYPHDFARFLMTSAKEALRTASEVDKNTVRITASDSLAAFLRDLLSDSVAPPPLKRPDFAHRYDLDRATVKDLCKRLDLDIAEVKALP
jgi:hypothetical protein